MYGGKKVKRRMLVTIVSAAMAGSLLAGCGSGQTAGEDATAADESADTGGEEVSGAYSSAEEVTLNVYNWHTERAEVYESIFSRFHEKYPNITVNYIAYDDDQYYSMLSTSIQSGEAPDLFATSGTKKIVFQNYVDMGACMPLDDFVDFSSYTEDQLSWGQIDGVTYMSPAALGDDYGVYYNKDIFDQYGLSEPQSWDELMEICETLKANGVVPFSLPGLDANTNQWFYVTMMIALAPEWNNNFLNEGKNDFEDDIFLESLKTYEDFRDKGYFGEDYDDMDANGAYMYFSSGNAAMMCDGSWMAGTFSAMDDVNIDMFHWPSKDGRIVQYDAPSTETGFSIYAETRHKEESLLLLNYLMTYEATQEVANLGNNVPILGIPGLEELSSPDPLMNKFAQADVRVKGFIDKDALYAKEGYDAFSLLNDSLQNILFEIQTPEEVQAAMIDMLDPAKYEK